MAYELHIKREPQGISLDEWLQAVTTVPRLRLTNAPAEASNPLTGETVSVPSPKGTVEVLSEEDEWFIAFRFARNQISFKATRNIESPFDPVHIAASALAEKLRAKIVGDEGELYSW